MSSIILIKLINAILVRTLIVLMNYDFQIFIQNFVSKKM